MDSNRRNFLKLAGLGATATGLGALPVLTGLSNKANAGALKNVVVIGGGFGGTTVAKYLRLWGQGQINVTHVNITGTYQSPILSNLILNGQKTLAQLTFNLAKAAQLNGITFVQGIASLDQANSQVIVKDAFNNIVSQLPYDKVILSPGIDFNYLPSMVSANTGFTDKTLPIPHAWQSGDQVLNLKAQIDKMPARTGVFVLCIPKKPYRCPPGPYERACVVADIVKRVKKGGKVIIFDANTPVDGDPLGIYSAIQAEAHTFSTAYTGQFASIIEYVPNAALVSVSNSGGQFGTKTVTVDIGGISRTESCHVLNVLPEHKAGKIAFDANLIPSGKFAAVSLDSYASTIDSKIHVIGDSHLSSQPKAGHIANSEAKVCADAIVREFGILPPRLVDEMPVTNSSCYSPITNTTASWLTAGYRYKADTNEMIRIPESFGEASAPSSDNYKTMLAWANNLFSDTFSV